MFKKKKIIVSVTNDISTDQRVHKVCSTLLENGYEVILIGRKLRNSLPLFRPYETKRMSLIFRKTGFFYAEYNIRLLLFLLFTKCDILLSNDTDTLLANFLASRIKKCKLVFDAHELFPESPEIAYKPQIKKVWRAIENLIFPRLIFCYTVCDSIAKHYKNLYGIEMKVIRNVPFTQTFDINPPNIDSLKKIESLKTEGRKIILYQGVINIGRGLEWMIDAMVLVDNAIFCIIGDGDITNQIKSKISDKNLEDRIFMLGKITPDILHYYTRLADLGVNLLEHRGLNQYYALPNRIFDFIQAEVPILSTDFPEISTITNQYSVGKVIDKYDAQSLSMTINMMLKEWETKPNRKEIFTRAKKELCWEEEKSILLNLFQKI